MKQETCHHVGWRGGRLSGVYRFVELLNLLVSGWLCVGLLGVGGGIGLVVDIVRVKVLNEGNQMKGLRIVVNEKRLIGGIDGFAE